MTRQELFEQIKQKNTYLCVGLDTDIQKIPKHLLACEDPIFEFNKQIIDATADFCVAYKINTAFYESLGWKGWQSLEKTFDYIPKSIFTIADAKRGDIGNTSSLYARAFFEQMQADSLTVAPYMGEDSVKPFLEYKDKWVILLALTSNSGSADFQWFKSENNQFLFEKVIETSLTWANADQMMYVLGATRIDYFKKIRQLIPEHFLLVPGYGAQGGDLRLVSELGLNNKCGLLVNSSRAIIYADDGKDFANQAQKIAKEIGQEMKIYLQEFC
ncbi:MAG: orotidine-5'-phosphate decarboxylase [Bacteroidetes bacterium]|nr:MAG: orotidine-5'-phosphate decarboxylase [Bacteroidota bacterium]